MTRPALAAALARRTLLLLSLVALSACTAASAVTTAPFAPPSPRYAAIVVEAPSGRVLHDTRADAIRFPASLTKMMTMYMVFEAMQQGRVSRSSLIPVSRRAAAQPPSKLYIKPGNPIAVDTALSALAVKSANDVAVAVAEYMSGSESRFAALMTRRARSLGMRDTVFRNASGLPDKRQVTTARDMAKLGIELRRRFPQYFHYFAKRSFAYNGRTIRGHNRVLGMLGGADGIKTGYTRASGFNLVTSVRRGRRTYVGVILGENSGRSRDRHMVQLMQATIR